MSIDEPTYKNLAHILFSSIGDSDYFNGSVEYNAAGVHTVLTATILIYRENPFDTCGVSHITPEITEVVPVWWECTTVGLDGPTNNDFSWREFKEFLLETVMENQ